MKFPFSNIFIHLCEYSAGMNIILTSEIQYLVLKLLLFPLPRKEVMRGCVVDKGSVKKKTDDHHPENKWTFSCWTFVSSVREIPLRFQAFKTFDTIF